MFMIEIFLESCRYLVYLLTIAKREPIVMYIYFARPQKGASHETHLPIVNF